jgi:hypothetical protein
MRGDQAFERTAGTVSGEFAECQVDRADSALVADAHAVAPMGNPTSST